MEPDVEAAARERSRATWDAMAAGWDSGRDGIWADSRFVGESLIQKLAPRRGDTVLELAAGVGDTGLLAARSVGETGQVLITDFAPEMVAAARRRAVELGIPNTSFRVLDAERMDLDTASVDGVVCRWGYMLMLNPQAAFAETRRVLRPGGRLAFSVWSTPEHNPWASLITAILVVRGTTVPPDPMAPGIFALADPTHVRTLVIGAGFSAPEIEVVPTHRRFADFSAYWRYLTELAGAISPILRSLPPEEQREVQMQLREAAVPFQVGHGYDLPGQCLNAVTSWGRNMERTSVCAPCCGLTFGGCATIVRACPFPRRRR
jgi:SAM-dependent methyltransferase